MVSKVFTKIILFWFISNLVWMDRGLCNWSVLGNKIVFGPTSKLMPRYLADTHFPRMQLGRAYVQNNSIPDTGSNRLDNSTGAMFGVLRIHPQNYPDRGVQFDFGAAAFNQFDMDNSLDNIGWDGVIQVLLTWTIGEHWAARTGLFHVSSHIGDEYITKTDNVRVGYTRNERIIGISYQSDYGLRTYGEVGWAYEMHDPIVQRRWRLQWGIEYIKYQVWANFIGWFAAIDIKSFEENNWLLTRNSQLGLILKFGGGGSIMRIGIEYYAGRARAWEFFNKRQKQLMVGMWLDL